MAFRLFKVARAKELELDSERFAPRPVDLDSRPWNQGWMDSAPPLSARIRFAEAARVEEHFDEADIEREGDGSALVRTSLPADEWAVTYLLGLGLAFEVLEPEALRRLVAERAAGLLGSNS
jgi:predicted DNA-binding transcriptional regulator YafY